MQNTSSFTKVSTFVKYAILDEMPKYYNKVNLKQTDIIPKTIANLKQHSGRKLTQIGDTNTFNYFNNKYLSTNLE